MTDALGNKNRTGGQDGGGGWTGEEGEDREKKEVDGGEGLYRDTVKFSDRNILL